MDSARLKGLQSARPCPICGNAESDIARVSNDKPCFVECRKCGARGASVFDGNGHGGTVEAWDNAVSAWNNSPVIPPPGREQKVFDIRIGHVEIIPHGSKGEKYKVVVQLNKDFHVRALRSEAMNGRATMIVAKNSEAAWTLKHEAEQSE